MGTCIGKRNIRYFVLFLNFTGVHSLISCIICLLFLIFRSSVFFTERVNKQEELKEKCHADPECTHVEQTNKEMLTDMLTIGMHAATLGIFLYTVLIALVLLPFGREMHD